MINAYTAWNNSSSWARHGRQFFEALAQHDQVRVWAFDSDPSGTARFTLGSEKEGSCNGNTQTIIGICPLPRFSEITGTNKIAFAVFESTYLALETIRVLKSFDRVWVASEWGRSVLVENGLSLHQIDVIPEGVDVKQFAPSKTLRDLRLQMLSGVFRPPFRFLSVGKWEVRKNIDGLVRAFAKAFKSHERVELVLHCTNRYAPFDYGARVRMLTGGVHAPILISKPRAWERMAELYTNADAFILPSRAEGWGLPIMEAMACGIPVITTAYGPPLEYTSPAYTYHISVERLVPIKDRFFYGQDQHGLWAEPSFEHTVELLRHVYEHREEAALKGNMARQAVVKRWTWNHAAAKAVTSLCRTGISKI